jgi:RNA polymerase sigma-70 factor (ECF subfamily)
MIVAMRSSTQELAHSENAAEGRLVWALRRGDEAAFAGLVERHHATMLRLARAYTGSDAVAAEVVQEAWAGVIAGLERFEARSSLKTWIFRILVNRAISAARRERRSVPFCRLEPDDDEGGGGPVVAPERFLSTDHPSLDGHSAAPPRPWQDPDRRLTSLELRAELREAFEELPARQQAVVGLRDVEGLDSEEVCDLLGLSEANQRVLLHRGRSRLRQALEDALVFEPA